MVDRHVVDVEVVQPAVIAGRHELDSVALRPVALDDEVAKRQVAAIDARSDVNLDHRHAARYLGHDRGAAQVDAHGPLNGAVNVDHDRLADREGAGDVRHITAHNRRRSPRTAPSQGRSSSWWPLPTRKLSSKPPE